MPRILAGFFVIEHQRGRELRGSIATAAMVNGFRAWPRELERPVVTKGIASEAGRRRRL